MKPIFPKGIDDIDPEEVSIDVAAAYALGRDEVRIACQLTAENASIFKYQLMDVSMTTANVMTVRHVREDYLMGYATHDGVELIVELGNIVHRRTRESDWESTQPGNSFLQNGFISEPHTEFVFGKDGEMFIRREGGFAAEDTGSRNELVAMDGGLDTDLYVVGANGTMLRGGPGRWEPVDLRLTSDLRAVAVNNRRVYFGGDMAVFGWVQDDEISIPESDLDDDILSICAFQENVFIADADLGVSILRDDRIEPLAEIGYVYKMTSTPSFLTCAGAEYIFQFDGSRWRAVRLIFDGTLRSEIVDTSDLN